MKKNLLKNPLFYVGIIILIFLSARHFINIQNAFYMPAYPKVVVSTTDNTDKIFKYTGLSIVAANEMLSEGRLKDFETLNRMYFEMPKIKKQYILFPITAEEKTSSALPPLAPVKKGDILVSFSTHTLDWRHGHIALALTDGGELMLEHISVGKNSVITQGKKWNKYANFAVLRHPDKKLAQLAADYSLAKLEGIPYNICAGLKTKDKSNCGNIDSSHCSHIVWQAYKALGVDLDSNGGKIVTPNDIAMSDKLKVVQIYGLNPKDFENRILTQ